jgi:hypothetical protein
MAPLTERERRTVRIGAVAVAIYLVLFSGFGAWKSLGKKRTEYQDLIKDSLALRARIKPYEEKVLVVSKLMESFHLDPARLSRGTVVGSASAAIQKAAMSGGLQVGVIRESPAHATGKELATMQLDCSGPVPALMGFLSRMEGLGYPLIIESIHMTPENSRPGQVKMNLTVVILDFEQWKKEAPPNA